MEVAVLLALAVVACAGQHYVAWSRGRLTNLRPSQEALLIVGEGLMQLTCALAVAMTLLETMRCGS